MLTWLVIGINVLLILIWIGVYFWGKRKWAGIRHYEKIRDELTTRELEVEEELKSSGVGLGNILSLVVGGILVIGVALPITSQVMDTLNTQSQTMNVTGSQEMLGATSTILNMVPIFLVLGILVTIVNAFVGFGRLEEEPKKKDKKKADGIIHYEKVRDKLTERK